tara:strand:+ start:34 stop:255 length:222 start_codon:yes stop_codon:yes gene_type:complete
MRTKAEETFIDQYTRSILVKWGDHLLRGYDSPSHQIHEQPYLDHALKKAWVTKKEPRRLTAKGWQTAASFLKR